MKKLTKFLFALIAASTLIFTGCTGSPDNSGNNNSGSGGQNSGGLSSVEMAAAMSVGWNLGNTLDANSETGWGMPVTTQAMIDAVRDAGFKTIRIPVSWHYHISSSDTTNYTIDSSWMARVKEIVDYAYNDGLYVILNIHHDNMAISTISSNPGFALSDDSSIQTKSKNYISKVWTQIATTFADYDDKLVFEVLNEPRDYAGEYAKAKGYSNCSEWWTNQETEIAIITTYEQAGIDAIRAVSGNEDRFIMVPGYAASGADTGMLSLYTMPTDETADDKLMLSTHAYSPYAFAMSDLTDKTFDSSDKSSLDSIFSYLKTNYTDKGIGVVMGEASASDKNNTTERVNWATYYFTKAKDANISVVLWDNMVTLDNGGDSSSGENHGYLNRNKCQWYFPTIIKAMMSACGVTTTVDGTAISIPEYTAPTLSSIGWNSSNAKTLDTTTYTFNDTGWGVAATYGSGSFSNAKSGSILKLIMAPISGAEYSKLCIYKDTSWDTFTLSGDYVGGSVSGDSISPGSGTTEIYYVLTDSDASKFKSSGITFRGYGVTLTGVYFQE